MEKVILTCCIYCVLLFVCLLFNYNSLDFDDLYCQVGGEWYLTEIS